MTRAAHVVQVAALAAAWVLTVALLAGCREVPVPAFDDTRAAAPGVEAAPPAETCTTPTIP